MYVITSLIPPNQCLIVISSRASLSARQRVHLVGWLLPPAHLRKRWPLTDSKPSQQCAVATAASQWELSIQHHHNTIITRIEPMLFAQQTSRVKARRHHGEFDRRGKRWRGPWSALRRMMKDQGCHIPAARGRRPPPWARDIRCCPSISGGGPPPPPPPPAGSSRGRCGVPLERSWASVMASARPGEVGTITNLLNHAHLGQTRSLLSYAAGRSLPRGARTPCWLQPLLRQLTLCGNHAVHASTPETHLDTLAHTGTHRCNTALTCPARDAGAGVRVSPPELLLPPPASDSERGPSRSFAPESTYTGIFPHRHPTRPPFPPLA
jgi:hypothetical protein